MPQTKLRITIPETVWIGELTRQYSGTTVRILAAQSDEESGVGLAEIESSDLDALLADMAAYEEVVELEVLNRSESRALIQFETTLPLLLLPARDSGVPLEMPFELSDGIAVWEITAPSDRLSELGSQLRAFDISFQIDYFQQTVESEQLLTDTQIEAVETALRRGYYDTPRQCSLTELADELGIAKSTASETLHRAEEKIIKQFADDVRAEEPQPVSPRA